MEKHNEDRYEQWRELIEEQRASGLSLKEFCKQRELILSRFVYYRCRIKNESKLKPGTTNNFVPVKVLDQEKSPSLTEIKLLLPNGFQFVFSSQIDVRQVKNLVEVLLSC